MDSIIGLGRVSGSKDSALPVGLCFVRPFPSFSVSKTISINSSRLVGKRKVFLLVILIEEIDPFLCNEVE